MEEERLICDKEETDRWNQLLARHTKELDSFDIETTGMGLNAAEVTHSSLEAHDDDISIRGSMLSLSGSSSSNSFTSHTPLT